MAFSKAPLFPEREYTQSLWNKATAHPARIIILEYLLENGITPFWKICQLVNLAPTTVSQHLRYLRVGQYIEPHTIYPSTYYSIPEIMHDTIAQLLEDYRKVFAQIKRGDQRPPL